MNIAEMVEEVKTGTASRMAALNELIENNQANALAGSNLGTEEVERLTQKRDGFSDAVEMIMPAVERGEMFRALSDLETRRTRMFEEMMEMEAEEAQLLSWRREGWRLAYDFLRPLSRLAI